jgi:extradiol dioxygenase family protein
MNGGMQRSFVVSGAAKSQGRGCHRTAAYGLFGHQLRIHARRKVHHQSFSALPVIPLKPAVPSR